MFEGLQIGPVGSGAREDEGTRGKKKEKKKKKDDQVVLTTKFLFNTRAGPDAFPHEKMKNRKCTKAPQTRRKQIKTTFRFWFFIFTWFGYFPWAGGFWVWEPNG